MDEASHFIYKSRERLMPPPPSACVVGSGVSGLVCAHLLSREFSVTVVESAPELGMDSSSRTVDRARVDVPLRTFSEDYYLNLTKIYKEIGVQYQQPDYSFCCYFENRPAHFRYTSWVRNWFTFGVLGIEKLSVPGTTLAMMPRCLWHMYEFWSFLRTASKRLQDPNNGLDKITFREYVLATHSEDFYRELLLPMLSVICTCTHQAVGDYPAEVLLDYLAGRAHLYPMGSSPQRAVSGTRDVVNRLSSGCERVITNARVVGVEPLIHEKDASSPAARVRVTWRHASGEEETKEFDHVIIATQANAALELLGKTATEAHRRALGAIRYERNRTVLHTDESVLPPAPDHAVCNLGIDPSTSRSDCTIWMNKVDPALAAGFNRDVFQTWNPLVEPSKDKVLLDVWFERPVVTLQTSAALDLLAELQGQQNLWFIGAYSLYSMPLLENGTRSAIRVANRLLTQSKVPEIGRQISGANFERRRPDLVALSSDSEEADSSSCSGRASGAGDDADSCSVSSTQELLGGNAGLWSLSGAGAHGGSDSRRLARGLLALSATAAATVSVWWVWKRGVILK